MQCIKVFLASSYSLCKDRDDITVFLSKKNNYLVKHGLFLNIVRWEFLSSSFSGKRKQDEFNVEVLSSEIFIGLIHDHIGKYTKEEFVTAFQSFNQGLNPKKLYIFFKKLTETEKQEFADVAELRSLIEENEQIYLEYENIDQLKLFINQNLDEDLPTLVQDGISLSTFESNEKAQEELISDYILNSLDDADRKLSKKLDEEALKEYEQLLTKVSKTKYPVLYSRIKLNIATLLLRKTYFDNQESDFNNAILYLEDAEKLFDQQKDKFYYIQTQFQMAYAYIKLGYIRNRRDNLLKAITIAKNALSMITENEFPEIFTEFKLILGSSYLILLEVDRKKEFGEYARDYLLEGLQRSSEKQHDEYCSLLIEISTAYFQLSSFEKNQEKQIEMLNDALQNVEKALGLSSFEENPIVYGNIQNQIGNLYSLLGNIKKDYSCYEKSILSYQSALSCYSDQPTSSSYIILRFNLISLYINSFSLTKNPQTLMEARNNCEEVLRSISRKTFPYHFSLIHLQLAKTYCFESMELTQENEKKTNLYTKALESLKEAELVFTKPFYPSLFLLVLYFKSLCHYELSKVEDHSNDLVIAKEEISKAWDFYEEGREPDFYYDRVKELREKINNS